MRPITPFPHFRAASPPRVFALVTESTLAPWEDRETLRVLGVFAVLIALAAGCAAKRPPEPAPAPPPSPADVGASKATYIFDPANPALHLDADVKFTRPFPDAKNALPPYPERPLREHAGTHREVVRIVIDTKGDVTQVMDSPVERSDGGPYAADFRSAVETAVRTWRYSSGIMMKVAPGKDLDGDGKVDYTVTTSTERVAVYYDVRFTFEIVNGAGVVTAK